MGNVTPGLDHGSNYPLSLPTLRCPPFRTGLGLVWFGLVRFYVRSASGYAGLAPTSAIRGASDATANAGQQWEVKCARGGGSEIENFATVVFCAFSYVRYKLVNVHVLCYFCVALESPSSTRESTRPLVSLARAEQGAIANLSSADPNENVPVRAVDSHVLSIHAFSLISRFCSA